MLSSHKYGIYCRNIYKTIRRCIKDGIICTMTRQQMPLQPKGTRIALTNHESRPYAHLSMDSIAIGSLKLYPSQRYSFKNHVLVLVCLNSGHITPESISSLSSRFIGLALRMLELKYSTKVTRVYSDNYSSFLIVLVR